MSRLSNGRAKLSLTPMWILGLLYCCLSLWDLVHSAKILVYSPSISASHLISNGRIADTLVNAGHDVVMFIPEYMSTTNGFTGSKKAKIIRMYNISSRFENELADADEYLFTHTNLGFTERLMFEKCLTHMCDELMKRKEELKVLREYKFDVAFAEQIDLCGIGVIRYLGIDNLLWISTTPIMDAVSYNLGIPAPVSYVPTIEENDNGDVMSFWDRLYNLYMYLGAIGIHRYGTDQTTQVFRSHVSSDFPNVRDIAANSSLAFVNSDEMFDLPRPILHKNIYIGGLGIKDPKELDEKFSSIMSKGLNGVIVMSMGSIAHFHAFPAEVKTDIAKVVERMSDYHFLFKITKGDTSTPEFFKHLKNVDFVYWLPQSDLLAHPRLRVFIMHGGVNGLTESMLRGVPVVIIPVFADQFRNGRNSEKRGVGKVVLKLDLDEKHLYNALNEIVTNPRYKQNALKYQKLMREKPFSAEDRLVKWTEFAANNGVLDSFHVEGAKLNFIIYFNIDVFAFIFAVFFIVLLISFKIIRFICCRSSKSVMKIKKH